MDCCWIREKDAGEAAAEAVAKAVEAWEVIAVAADGNCLFNSVAQSMSAADGGGILSRSAEHAQAKFLRARAVEELVSRQAEIEWAMEGEDFSSYKARMSKYGTWGGEIELVMLSHCLQRQIQVFMRTPGWQLILTYGGDLYDFSKPPVRVLFHDRGHYEALSQRAKITVAVSQNKSIETVQETPLAVAVPPQVTKLVVVLATMVMVIGATAIPRIFL